MNHAGHIPMDQAYELEVARSWKFHGIGERGHIRALGWIGHHLKRTVTDWATVHTGFVVSISTGVGAGSSGGIVARSRGRDR